VPKQREGGISWTDYSWNPIRGCSRVSRGCEHCYAEKIAARFSDDGVNPHDKSGQSDEISQPFAGFAERTTSGPRWTGKVELIEHKLTEPLHRPSWRGKRVFVNSMSDLFHEKLSDDDVSAVYAVMALCPEVTFQVLTKRPKRMAEWVRYTHPNEIWDRAQHDWTEEISNRPWPLPNVHLGVSVEGQEHWVPRVRALCETPAAVRFVSYEPALGPLGEMPYLNLLDWLIAGGESGPGARPAHPDWFRKVRDQCAAAGVPFFFKQWGEWAPVGTPHPRPAPVCSMGVVNVGKKRAGSLLDGKEHKEFPND